MSQPRDPQPRTVLEGVDFNDLWNEREALKADLAAARARLVELEAIVRENSDALSGVADIMERNGQPVSGLRYGIARLRELRRPMRVHLTGTPAADAPHETTKREE